MWWFKPRVKFYVKPVDGSDLEEIARILEKANVSASVWNPPGLNINYIFCDAKRKIYERLFSAKVEYTGRRWVEAEPAKIPESLKDLVESVELEGYGSLLV